jgi:bacterioferritin
MRVDQPYPPIEPKEQNPEYAAAMLSNVGGTNSEISAVTTYFYDRLLLLDDPELSDLFHQISIVEMQHLEIFGTLALKLGADPRLWEVQGSGMVYWSPADIYYPTDMMSLLREALRAEQAAVKKYSQQIRTIKDANIVANLERIILDEQQHIVVFRNLINER